MPEPSSILSPTELARYSRHILLDNVGVQGQEKLARARVLVVGAGGLGSPAALYLAAAGIGTLGIADLDRVEHHNLQRQLLHDTSSVGAEKVSSAAQRLRTLNPHISVLEHPAGITTENAADVFRQYDIVLDGTDNFSARYINNDAAFETRKPLVFGSVYKFEGQVTVFDPSRGGPCYRCLFPTAPAAGSVPGCGEAGVIGALCGVIGSMQALETIKLILQLGETLTGRLLTYDALTQNVRILKLARSPTCELCGDKAAEGTKLKKQSTAQDLRSLSTAGLPAEITVAEANELLTAAASESVLLDVREPWEIEICHVRNARFIPMRQIPEKLGEIPEDRHILVLCHHGSRSRQVAHFLSAHGYKNVSNVAGGIAAWADEIDPTLARY
ncbi:MAG: molybdopterin-synthase adenylyltransferase MoeB [Opitutus sp.]